MPLGNNLKSRELPEAPNKVSSESSNEEAQSVTDTDAVESESNIVEKRQQFCIFRSGKQEYAIPINIIREVVPLPAIAKVPQMPNYITGMSNVRGNIFGVMDLGLFFNGNGHNSFEAKYLLVIDDEEYQMGITIPEVPDTLMVTENSIEQLTKSQMKSQTGQKYLKGLIKKDKRMIIVFDILGMISGEKFTFVN